MNTNFCFLKKIDNELYSIILDAEKLYQDEYFEQCIVQTRKFGENICKKTLGYNCESFDESLATLKDKIGNTVQEKEFVEDLYFLKKHGNISAHSAKAKNDPFLALECLQRAFETALNYSVYKRKANQKLLKRQFDTELLITGKKSQKSLSQRYLEEKQKTKSFRKQTNPAKNTKKQSKQVTSIKTETPTKTISAFWILVAVSFVFAFITMVFVSI